MSSFDPHKAGVQIRPMTPLEQQMHEDLRWAMANVDLEERHAGEYVVVWKKQVVAHGMDLEETLRRAATAERPREELVVVGVPTFFESPH
jgi:hypothetical protein